MRWPGRLQTRVFVQDGQLVAQNTQQAKPYADMAQALSTERVQDKDFKLAGHYPAIMVEKYLADNGITLHEFFGNQEHAKRMLNDPNLAMFRVWKGKV